MTTPSLPTEPADAPDAPDNATLTTEQKTDVAPSLVDAQRDGQDRLGRLRAGMARMSDLLAVKRWNRIAIFWGVLLALVVVLVVVAYYLNKPGLETDPDTPAYLNVVHTYDTRGFRIDLWRLPGYPILIWLVFKFAGKDNLGALQIVQMALFAVAAVEIYVLLRLIQRSSFFAFLLALLVGTNVVILSYAKLLLSEGLEIFLIANVALTIILFLRRPQWWRFWLVVGVALALFLTRPEWMYLPLLLYPFLCLIALQRARWRWLVANTVLALIVFYAVVGGYSYINRVKYGCTCVTVIQNLNALGKVMQYHMQNEAPPQYQAMSQLVNSYVEKGDTDPWDLTRTNYSWVNQNNFAILGEYSDAIVIHHPIEFLSDSLPLGVQTLVTTEPSRPIHPDGLNETLLSTLQQFSVLLMRTMILFPLAALFWWGLLLWRVWRRRPVPLLLQAMAALSLIGFYGLAITTLGGYVYYPRLHAPFDSLMIIVAWGSVLLGIGWLIGKLAQLPSRQ